MNSPFDIGYAVYHVKHKEFGTVVGLSEGYAQVELEDGDKVWAYEYDLMYADTAEHMLGLCDCEWDELGDEVEVGY